MPLSHDLDDVLLSFKCPKCSHALARTGRWFVQASRFKCASCGDTVRITYDDKLLLFARHQRLLRHSESASRPATKPRFAHESNIGTTRARAD
jgi:DNA-directed RNA polymerase subunit RPC12/RpoP